MCRAFEAMIPLAILHVRCALCCCFAASVEQPVTVFVGTVR